MKEIPVKPVSRLLIDAVLEAHPLPPAPLVDGKPLSLKRLKDAAAWQNNGRRKKAARLWAQYLDDLAGAVAERHQALFKALLVWGVDLEPPPLAEWGQDLAELGIEAATVGAGTLKILWIHRLRPEAKDKVDLLVQVMEQSDLPADTLTAIRGAFDQALAAAA